MLLALECVKERMKHISSLSKHMSGNVRMTKLKALKRICMKLFPTNTHTHTKAKEEAESGRPSNIHTYSHRCFPPPEADKELSCNLRFSHLKESSAKNEISCCYNRWYFSSGTHTVSVSVLL